MNSKLNCMFEVIYDKCGLYHPKVKVYDVKLDDNGETVFLVYMPDYWNWKPARFFTPIDKFSGIVTR